MAEDLSGFSLLELFKLEAESQTAILSAGVLAIEESSRSPQTIEAMMRAECRCGSALPTGMYS